MTSEERDAQFQSSYRAALKQVKTTPLPKGQKYPPGTRVMINGFLSGRSATVLYTYAHAYGGDNVKDYCLDVDGLGSVAWYDEDQMTPIVGSEVRIRP